VSTVIPLQGVIVRSSLSDDVYERIVQAIVSGVLASGAILHEVSLARQLNVSRTPVHEALRRLAADGLVEHLPNRRARVAMFSQQTLRDIYDLRALLEQAAAERAATRLSENEIEKLRKDADAIRSARTDAEFTKLALKFDLTFHDALAEACGNEHLRKEIAKYRRLVQAFCRMTGTPDILREAFVEHQEVLVAIEKRDGKLAGEKMAAHIQARANKAVQTVSDHGEAQNKPTESRQIVSVNA